MISTDKFCTRRVSELVPYENNPRNNKRAVDAVAECIRRFGFRGAIVIDANNIIVCGHTRVEAAKKLGMDTLPCEVITDLTESEIRAYRLADNKTAELANWRDDLLAAELDAVSEIDMSLFGFDSAKLGGVVEDEFDPDPPALPFSQDGDVYVLGRHRLIVGNACDQSVIARLMGGSKVDMYLTDPPYNVDYKGTAGVIKKQNTVLEYDRPMRSKDHPTMKPVLLFDALIQNSTREGEIVFDSFAGSGTTLAACEQNGRVCYCSELDPRFADVIVRRYYQYSSEYRNSYDPDTDIFVIRDGKRLKFSEVIDL